MDKSLLARQCHEAASKAGFFAYRFCVIGAMALALAACHEDGIGASVEVAPPPSAYHIGGSIVGLGAPGLVLKNNGGGALTLAANTASFQFATAVAAGGGYDVTVSTQPAGLTCIVSQGSGSNVTAPVSNVAITCTANTYAVAGTVTGLSAAGLVLQNEGGDNLSLTAHTSSFRFASTVAAGGSYNVTVAAQPTGLTCTVSHGSGSGVTGPITDVSIVCNPLTYTVAGAVTGLTTAGLVLQNNGADNLTVNANATAFKFAAPIAAGGGYRVTVSAQPTGLTCTVSQGIGTNVTANVGGIIIICGPTALTVGGTVSGLTAAGLVLQDNGGDNLTVAASATAFVFATSVAYGGGYAITVLTQPAGQICAVSNGANTATANVTGAEVTCSDIITYTLTASAGANGIISPSGPVSVNSGAAQGFVANPNSGYAVSQWLLDGTAVQAGGATYTVSNVTANHSVQATFGQAALSSSVASLALSVDNRGLNAALTGNPRQISIQNAGTISAVNVSVVPSGLPAGSVISSSTCSGTLAAAASCTLTVTPGAIASSNCTAGIVPNAGTVTVPSDNASTTTVNVVVLGYGCIYQGGYLYSVDDTTPNTASLGGKVAAQFDQAPASSGVLWSSDSSGTSDLTVIYGIGEASTVGSPSPSANQYPGQAACNGATDGACDTNNINVYYNIWVSPPVTTLSYYAADLCKAALMAGYSDWYLPAICEMGPDSGAGICPTAPAEQNMGDNLDMLVNGCTGSMCLAGFYWSSTEFSGFPAPYAWYQYLSSGGGNHQGGAAKSDLFGARCSRALTSQ